MMEFLRRNPAIAPVPKDAPQWTECFHRVHNWAHSLYVGSREYDTWELIKTSGRFVVLDKDTQYECLVNNKVVFISEANLRFPVEAL